MDGGHEFAAPAPHRWCGRWGYDPAFECFWAEVVVPGDRGVVRVGVEHLVPTLAGLARVLAARLGVSGDEVFVALTHVRDEARRAGSGRAA